MRKRREQFLLYRVREHEDQNAFAELHKEHSPHVYRFLCSKLPSQEDAHDALTTTFLRLWNYLRSSSVDYLSALTFTIARGVVAEFYRGNDIETVSYDEEESNIQINDEGEGAGSVVNAADAELVKRAMNEIPDHYKEVIILRYFEDMPVKDIAQHLDKTENATRVMIHRGIKKLRNAIEA